MNKFFGTHLFLGTLIFFLIGPVFADPPVRVMRLSAMDGAVTFAPASIDQWVYATRNRPLTTGDRLWADQGAHAELQLGAAAISMGNSTSINILNLDDKTAQIELDQGSLILHIWNVSSGKGLEIDTPNLAFTVGQPGEYRVNVDNTNNTTTVVVRHGQAVVFGEDHSYQINSGESYRFAGVTLNDYQALPLPALDSFDNWSVTHSLRRVASPSAKFVSSAMIGSEDLDTYGRWQTDAKYRNVWYPNNVSTNWAPYSEGEWTWVDPWGWTWVDHAPWGFAPFHYGRWVYLEGGWGWVPGPMVAEPVYAPALVVFFGGNTFDAALSVRGGGIGWLPLGPEDVFIPSYGYSQNYFNIVNDRNAFINRDIVINAYQHPHQNFIYRNMQVPHAVTAVTKEAFVHSVSVSKSAINVSSTTLRNAHPSTFAPLAPVRASVTGSANLATVKPSAQVLARPVIARTRPPAPPVPFSLKQQMLEKNPGLPVTQTTLSTMNHAPTNSIRQINVVRPTAPVVIPVVKPPAGVAQPRGVHMQPIATPARPSMQVPHPPISTTPGVIQHRPTGIPQHVSPAPNIVPHPEPVAPHYVPREAPHVAPVAPHYVPREVPHAAPVAPHYVPREAPHAAPVAPHYAPQEAPHAASVAPHYVPREVPHAAPVAPHYAPREVPHHERRE